MERNLTETECNQTNAGSLNEDVVYRVIADCLKSGVEEFCLCPGARNSAFVDCLQSQNATAVFFHYEERSAAFFALGRAKSTGKPVAVITTSGTAVGELLPAAMEAFYSGVPLLLITADRPSHFRGSGAPQSAEQVGIFGIYAPYFQDVEGISDCNLSQRWGKTGPAHINVCLEEQYNHDFDLYPDLSLPSKASEEYFEANYEEFTSFVSSVKYPVAIVGSLPGSARQEVAQFLQHLNIPVYIEATSGIRHDSRLEGLRLKLPPKLSEPSYPIDGVLRIGSVPTLRLWRDLEKLGGSVQVCSLSHLPFPGLSWSTVVPTLYTDLPSIRLFPEAQALFDIDRKKAEHLELLLKTFPASEPAMVRQLSRLIHSGDTLYLGNSMPIREWDLTADNSEGTIEIHASRGLNGIDGQLSTFFGVCRNQSRNWCLLGDLTTMYDLAGPWILPQLNMKDVNIVVMNNGGGRIFERLFKNQKLQNRHHYSFEHFAKLWQMDYAQWDEVPKSWESSGGPTLIECLPSNEETQSFWKELKQ